MHSSVCTSRPERRIKSTETDVFFAEGRRIQWGYINAEALWPTKELIIDSQWQTNDVDVTQYVLIHPAAICPHQLHGIASIPVVNRKSSLYLSIIYASHSQQKTLGSQTNERKEEEEEDKK